ncbi:MAG: hypothetical protein PHY20_02660 [Bacteroidales bacterium]|nr:hypothetical protein [Bacteroidales bacterium]
MRLVSNEKIEMPDLIRHTWDNRGETFNWELFDKTAALIVDALTRGWED